MAAERSDHTLSPFALVQVVCMRLSRKRTRWNERVYFYAAATTPSSAAMVFTPIRSGTPIKSKRRRAPHPALRTLSPAHAGPLQASRGSDRNR
ncbi:MAG: hypothetical protein JNK25_10030 [Phycisphaerae bacterium]|nr:hypothetical protein [Phycisphaerae bacterium]